MTAAICVSCGLAFRRGAEQTWRTTCYDCWRKGARREPVPVRIHQCAGGQECDARAVLREVALRVPSLLTLIEGAAEPATGKQGVIVFLRGLVQRVAEIEGGR